MNGQDPRLVLEGLRRKEDWAYTCLADRCFPPFIKHARQRCATNNEDIDDLFQETIAKLILYLDRHPDFVPRTDIFAYFYTMLRYGCAEKAGKRAEFRSVELPDNLPEEPANQAGEKILDYYCRCLEDIREENANAARVLECQYARYYTCTDQVAYKTDEELAEQLSLRIDYIRVLRNRWRPRLQACMAEKMQNQG